MYTVNLLLYSYFVIAISSLFFFFLGDAFLKYGLKVSLPISAKRTFAALLTGVFACVFFYSVFKTAGNTASLLFIPLIGCYFFFRRCIIKETTSLSINDRLPLFKISKLSVCGFSFLVSMLLYVLFCYANLDGDMHFRPVEGDDYSYGMLAQYLNRGFENGEFSRNLWADGGLYPYHYFEIWLDAMVYEVFQLNSLWTFSLIVPVILYTIIFWGLMSVVEQYHRLNLMTAGICFIFLFTTEISIVLSYLGQEHFPYPMQYCSGLILTKIAPISLFLLAVVLLLFNNKKHEALLVALGMPIVSFAMTPIIFTVAGCLILRDMVRDKVVKYEYLVPFLVSVCLFASYVLSGGATDGLSKLPSISDVKLRLFITNPVGFGLRYIFLIALILLIDLKRFFRFCKRYFFEILMFFIVSTGFSAILRLIDANAVQFVSLSYYGIFNIIFPALILFYWRVNYTHCKKVLLLAVFIVGYSLNVTTVVSFFSDNQRLSSVQRLEYEQLVMDGISNEPIRVGMIRAEDEVAEWSGYNLVNQNLLTAFIDAYTNGNIYYSIVKGTGGLSRKTAFSELLAIEQNNNPNLTQDEFRVDFIKLTGIGFVILYPGGVIPDNLADNLQLIAQDADSGERFYKIVNL
jgi:hypothetical protein